MDKIRILSNSSRISDLESDVAALAAVEGVTLPISQPLNLNNNAIENVSQLELEGGGTLTYDTGLKVNGVLVHENQTLSQAVNSNTV